MHAVSRFQNHNCHALCRSVRDGKRDVADSQTFRKLRRFAVELQRRPAGRQVRHLEIAPANSTLPTRADCFHAGLLSGEARSVAFVLIGLSLYVSDLFFSVDALDESLAMPLDGLANPVHFRQVDADSNNHNSTPVEVMVSLPCFTPLVLIKASAIFFTTLALPFTTNTSRQLS
jgi:hypothetical protein